MVSSITQSQTLDNYPLVSNWKSKNKHKKTLPEDVLFHLFFYFPKETAYLPVVNRAWNRLWQEVKPIKSLKDRNIYHSIPFNIERLKKIWISRTPIENFNKLSLEEKEKFFSYLVKKKEVIVAICVLNELRNFPAFYEIEKLILNVSDIETAFALVELINMDFFETEVLKLIEKILEKKVINKETALEQFEIVKCMSNKNKKKGVICGALIRYFMKKDIEQAAKILESTKDCIPQSQKDHFHYEMATAALLNHNLSKAYKHASCIVERQSYKANILAQIPHAMEAVTE